MHCDFMHKRGSLGLISFLCVAQYKLVDGGVVDCSGIVVMVACWSRYAATLAATRLCCTVCLPLRGAAVGTAWCTALRAVIYQLVDETGSYSGVAVFRKTPFHNH